jgi:hypothetical protein
MNSKLSEWTKARMRRGQSLPTTVDNEQLTTEEEEVSNGI